MGSALFRNLHFLQKALRFLGIPRTLALAQVGAAISTVPQWATVEMAALTWARTRMGMVEMAAPTCARARAGPHPACLRAHTRSSRRCAFYRKRAILYAFYKKRGTYVYIYINDKLKVKQCMSYC